MDILCHFCKNSYTLPISESDLLKYQVSGKLIQNYFPQLSADERELLISGMCGKCFDGAFAEPSFAMPDKTDYELVLFEEAIEKAIAAGFEVLRPQDNELYLDLDNDEALLRYQERYPVLSTIMGCHEVNRWKSKSGLGYHVVLELQEPKSDVIRIGMQAILGSDPKREALAYSRIHKGIPNPILLFKPKTA